MSKTVDIISSEFIYLYMSSTAVLNAKIYLATCQPNTESNYVSVKQTCCLVPLSSFTGVAAVVEM